MKEYIVDLKTGFQGSVELSPEQEAARLAEQQEWAVNEPQRARNAVLQELRASDYRLARATEDLISALVSRGAIFLSELPPSTVQMLADRKRLREAL